jgi:RNA polymerase sigma factor FliA
VLVTAQVYQKVNAQAQREDLILGNLSLVRHILGRLSAKLPMSIDLDNLEAAGTLGLVEAANRYQPERGAFRTFAYTRIRGAIFDELRRNSPFPQEMLERITKVRKVLQSLAPPVQLDELARRTGLSELEVNECLAAMRMNRTLSIEETNEPSQARAQPDHQMEEKERKHLLAEAIAELPETERVTVTLYYMEELRLKEIGAVLHLSESRVSRLLKSAEHRIEEYIRAREECAA